LCSSSARLRTASSTTIQICRLAPRPCRGSRPRAPGTSAVSAAILHVRATFRPPPGCYPARALDVFTPANYLPSRRRRRGSMPKLSSRTAPSPVTPASCLPSQRRRRGSMSELSSRTAPSPVTPANYLPSQRRGSMSCICSHRTLTVSCRAIAFGLDGRCVVPCSGQVRSPCIAAKPLLTTLGSML
jgi:hypothetical protein